MFLLLVIAWVQPRDYWIFERNLFIHLSKKEEPHHNLTIN